TRNERRRELLQRLWYGRSLGTDAELWNNPHRLFGEFGPRVVSLAFGSVAAGIVACSLVGSWLPHALRGVVAAVAFELPFTVLILSQMCLLALEDQSPFTQLVRRRSLLRKLAEAGDAEAQNELTEVRERLELCETIYTQEREVFRATRQGGNRKLIRL